MSHKCCRHSGLKCRLREHNPQIFSIPEYTKRSHAVFDFFNNISRNAFFYSARDDLVTHALEYELLPEGNIPKDGSCMFHSLAQSLSLLLGSQLDQKTVRSDIVSWLSLNPMYRDDHLSEFVPNLSQEEYLQRMSDNATTNTYSIRIGVISSQHCGLTFIEPDHEEYVGTVYLGHEYEFHYIRLEPMTRVREPTGMAIEDAGSNHVDSSFEGPPDLTMYSVYNEPVPRNESSKRVFLCDLPHEVLELILKHIVSLSAAYIGLLESLFPMSVRFIALVSQTVLPRVHISSDIVAHVEENAWEVSVGQLYEWSLAKLYRYTGKISGLAIELRRVFGNFKGWPYGKVVLCATGHGWFKIQDFTPKGGWEK